GRTRPRPPAGLRARRRPPPPPLFPYTTLFRSTDTPGPPPGRPWPPSAPSPWPRPRPPWPPNRPPPPGRCPAPPRRWAPTGPRRRSEEHTSELQSREKLVCRLLLEKKKNKAERR